MKLMLKAIFSSLLIFNVLNVIAFPTNVVASKEQRELRRSNATIEIIVKNTTPKSIGVTYHLGSGTQGIQTPASLPPNGYQSFSSLKFSSARGHMDFVIEFSYPENDYTCKLSFTYDPTSGQETPAFRYIQHLTSQLPPVNGCPPALDRVVNSPNGKIFIYNQYWKVQ